MSWNLTNAERESLIRESYGGEENYLCDILVTGLINTPVDRGTVHGIAGKEMRQMCSGTHGPHGHVVGTVGAVVNTHRGPMLAIFHNYQVLPKSSSLHPAIQLEDDGHVVHDRSIVMQGKQHIYHKQNYIVPLNFAGGVAQLPMQPYNDHDYQHYPHVEFNSHELWDPEKFNLDLTSNSDWFREYLLCFVEPKSKKRKAEETEEE